MLSSLSETLLVSCLLLTVGVASASAQIVEIPDPNLRHAVREVLALPDEIPLTQQEILRLTRLEAPEKQIKDLTGLEYATNLEWIDVHRNNISDLKPLAELAQLERLGAWVNPISDLSPLTNLTKLRGLDLAGCYISDIAPLANLTQLEWLTLQWQQNHWITDITPLAHLTRLRDLRLSGNRIVDIRPLTNLIRLEILWIDNNRIIDIRPLANLTALTELQIENNSITDFSPLEELPLITLSQDRECELPGLPIHDRIENRNLPSILQPWGDTIINLPNLSRENLLAHHDLYWRYPPFGLQFRLTAQDYKLIGNIKAATTARDELLAKNPNMIFLAEIRLRDAGLSFHYPEDWPYWLRDENGNLVRNIHSTYLIDFRFPEVQDIIVQKAVAVSKCGLYDGIMFDWWNEGSRTLANLNVNPPIFYSTVEEESQIRLKILQRIRANVPNDFLILCNNNRRLTPISAPYINGSFLGTFRDIDNGYTHAGIIEIENALIWLEANLREPQINCLEGWGIPTEPPDSLTNLRFMRLFTAMSLTLSDGYVLYNVGNDTHENFNHDHIWYPFWDANLGQPIGPTTQRYQNIEGLYIREFTSGWAVYNRSGKTQTVSLPQSTTGVSSGQTNTTHQLPDLDGEIYLKAKNPADVNGDGNINVLDLVQVANGFGKSFPDPNGDGTTNILDLVFVANQFSQ